MDDAKPPQTALAEQKLQRAIWDSNEVLVSGSTVLSPYKTRLTLNRTKLVAEKRSGVAHAEVMSSRIEDVLNIDGSVGLLFGTLKIATKFTKPGTPYSIGLFRRKDALNLKRIIQGYIIALDKKVDVNDIPTDELRAMLYKLGEDDPRLQ